VQAEPCNSIDESVIKAEYLGQPFASCSVDEAFVRFVVCKFSNPALMLSHMYVEF
jgi:hypothetical protein